MIQTLLLRRPRLSGAILVPAFLLMPGLVRLLDAQGNLTPPPGTIAPTMKSLDQIEPRTPIPGGTTTFTISASGSYTLTGDLTITGGQGIIVNASHVTIDLNGFSLIGSGSGSGSGVTISSGVSNVTIRNGTVRNWSSGVSGASRTNIRAENLRAISNFNTGIIVGDHGAVIACVAEANALTGIRTGIGCVIRDCQAHGTTGTPGHGIDGGTDSVVTGCAATGNAGDGIEAGARSRVANCTANSNTGNGIGATSSCLVTECAASLNGGDGINCPSNNSGLTILRCNTTLNTGDGIECGGASLVEGNLCRGNGNGAGDGAGIHITNVDCRIEGNNVITNDRGIDVDFGGSLIIRNTAVGNTTNYVIAANNRYGPIVDITATGTAAVNGSSAADTTTSTHPWANFSH